MTTKRFPASTKKLKKLRKDGNIPLSRALNSFGSLFGAICVLWASDSWVRIGTLVQWERVEDSDPARALWGAFGASLSIVLWGAGTAAVGGLIAATWQSGGLVSLSSLASGFRKVRPSSYLTRVRQGVIDGALGCVRSVVVLLCLLPVLYALVEASGALLAASADNVMIIFRGSVRSVLVRGVAILGVIALVSYAAVRWRFFAKHRMSLEEVREEYKQDEGDPHVRAARRHEHQMLAMGELEKRVRNAKVIVIRRSPAQAERR
jgi:flagellar biosynthesis protein FlhB